MKQLRDHQIVILLRETAILVLKGIKEIMIIPHTVLLHHHHVSVIQIVMAMLLRVSNQSQDPHLRQNTLQQPTILVAVTTAILRFLHHYHILELLLLPVEATAGVIAIEIVIVVAILLSKEKLVHQ